MSEGPVRLPEISVLVPIYNVERYLAECLDSLVAQTFTDFEVILINDGSTDGSRDIISRYLEADQRFRVIDKPNSGYGASMNRGLDESLGTYVAILESDDFFVPDALKLLHDVAVREDSDVVKANFWLYWSVPEERREEFVIVTPEMAGRTMRPSSDEDKTIFYQKPSIWSALYRREFLAENAIRFLETPGASYQDASFNFKVWALAERASFIDDFILNYRQDNEASSVNSPGKVYCVCDEYAEMERFLEVRPALSERLRGVLTRMKFDSYMWNAGRLAPELRAEFLVRAREELSADREKGYVDESVLGVYKEADLRFLLDEPERFAQAFDSYGGGSLVKNLGHYLELGGPGLVAGMVAKRAKRGRS